LKIEAVFATLHRLKVLTATDREGGEDRVPVKISGTVSSSFWGEITDSFRK
jgi:hypothetical protein